MKNWVKYLGLSLFLLTSCNQSNNITNSTIGGPQGIQINWTFSPNIPISNLTQNNTSACGNSTSPCTEAWNQTQTVKYDSGSFKGQTKTVTGFWDNAVANSNQAPTSSYGAVSKIPIGVLLPNYPTVPVLVETQDWWGNGNGHINTGENSENAQQIKNEMADQVSRGFGGQVLDWYGYTQNGVTYGGDTQQDVVAQTIVSNIANYQYGPVKYKFALMIDKGYLQASNCNSKTTTMLDCLNYALSYMASKYFTSPYYMTDTSGHPLVYFFINSYTIPISVYNVLFDSGINYHNSKFVMQEPDGLGSGAPSQADGEYGWVNPSDASYIGVSGYKGSFSIDSSFGFIDMGKVWTAAEKYQNSYIVGQAYKGFDDNLANWSGNRIIDQQCGQTWLNTFNNSGNYGLSGAMGNLNYLKAGHKMNYIMVDTWDDFEEGTEIETGIDNCMQTFSATISGNNLQWTPSFSTDPMNSKVAGNESTIYKYSIYIGASGNNNVQWLADVTPTGKFPYSLDLTTYGITKGTYNFYVQAIGMPSIKNTLSTLSSLWTNSGSGGGGGGGKGIVVKVTSPVINQNVGIPTYMVGSATDSNGIINDLQVYLNGVLYSNFPNVTSFNAKVLFSGSGQKLTLKAWDNNNNNSYVDVTGLNGSCPSLMLDLPMPGNGITTSSPVTINGAGCSVYTLATMEIWDNSTQLYTATLSGYSAFIHPSIGLSKGTHNLWLKIWDNNPNTSKTYLDTQNNKVAVTIQ